MCDCYPIDPFDLKEVPNVLIKQVIAKADSIARFSRLCKGMQEICEGVTTKYEARMSYFTVDVSRKPPLIKIPFFNGFQRSRKLSQEKVIGFRKTAHYYHFKRIYIEFDYSSRKTSPTLGYNAQRVINRINEFLEGMTLTCEWLYLHTFIPFVNKFNHHINFENIKFTNFPTFLDAFDNIKNDTHVALDGTLNTSGVIDSVRMFAALRNVKTSTRKFGNEFNVKCLFDSAAPQKSQLHPIFWHMVVFYPLKEKNIYAGDDDCSWKTTYFIGQTHDEFLLLRGHDCSFNYESYTVLFYPTKRSLYEFIKTKKNILVDFWHEFNCARLEEMEGIVEEAYEDTIELEVGWNGEEIQLLFGQ